MTTQITTYNYNIKTVKTFHGHDGIGWEAKLALGSVVVATVVEDGWGGGLQFHWADERAPKARGDGTFEPAPKVDVVAHNLMDQKRTTYKGTPAEAAFALFCEALPKWRCNDSMIYTDMDIHVGNLVNAKLEERDVKRLLNKVAIFDGGKVYTFKVKSGQLDLSASDGAATFRSIIAKKYPDAVILNDLPLEEAVAIYKTAA